ncbi:PREDICTED: uncharacterized protein LOC105145937 [Acromyrmex echinatior]|uniref:uncharacterized protein LOC105145937 n=1 Tax=Acromyrmex echinatior TaxID=103372 RepID=UPI000580C7BE|nr:PREDICTED: uncharacterized protein LOC105145937 [Acromyrmex echinatior]
MVFRIHTTYDIRHTISVCTIFIITMNVERRVTDVVHSVNPTFQVHWIHLERPRATPERQNEQYYRKDGGNLHEGFLDSPRPPCFINRFQVSLPEGKNILRILITY